MRSASIIDLFNTEGCNSKFYLLREKFNLDLLIQFIIN